jgi:hypothetical protein
MYSQTFHRTPDRRVQKITVEEQFKPQNIESFDPVTQELYRDEFLEQFTQKTSVVIKQKMDYRT